MSCDETTETSRLLGDGSINTGGRHRVNTYGVGDPQPSTSSQDADNTEQLQSNESFLNITESMEGRLGHVQTEIINATFESLDYDHTENEYYVKACQEQSWYSSYLIEFSRWVILFVIGVITALVGCFIDIAITFLCFYKFAAVKYFLDRSQEPDGYGVWLPALIWVGWDLPIVFIASFCTAFFEPVAAGSGIPQIKCYLNGVLIPRVVRLKTLIIKAFGVIAAVAGGMVVGKEGPMIHSGAVVAAGISQGRATSFPFPLDFKCFNHFRTDQEKRDFVAGGAAAGVAAAFGAPMGGLLFSFEEGASYWSQGLTWRTFFCGLTSYFTLSVVISVYNGHPFELAYAGLLNFGSFENITYTALDLLVMLPMGPIGGLIGALFNFLNMLLTALRKRYITKPWHQVLETVVVSIFTGLIMISMIVFSDDCQPIFKDSNPNPVQMYCSDGEANAMGWITMQTLEQTVRSLFHNQNGAFTMRTLAVYSVGMYIIACTTYGLSIPSGLFIPCLVVGASWGRLYGSLAQTYLPGCRGINPGTYALIGAAAQLGGVVRMVVSLTVIMMEATGNITLGLPIMITLINSKLVGDLFNEGLYDIHIDMNSVPFLHWEPVHKAATLPARKVMSHPVVAFQEVEKVGHIIDTLKREKHQGYPVVSAHPDPLERFHNDGDTNFGTLTGLIDYHYLIVILMKKQFCYRREGELVPKAGPELNLGDFRQAYPRYTKVEDIPITDHELEMEIDLRPFMNPAPYKVSDRTSLARIFKFFRGLGLRHLVVINNENKVTGMITRKDLTRFVYKKGEIKEKLGCYREKPVYTSTS